ncbi:hypothetical protein [Prochlorococcus marinus]|uniref:hypothetical protein n=1 Tax=Prochlorococcus marinus TaxID=1219 RepID=UPI0022B518C2|nr:hypothetical protein [Prochlorococcus marinus]
MNQIVGLDGDTNRREICGIYTELRSLLQPTPVITDTNKWISQNLILRRYLKD